MSVEKMPGRQLFRFRKVIRGVTLRGRYTYPTAAAAREAELRAMVDFMEGRGTPQERLARELAAERARVAAAKLRGARRGRPVGSPSGGERRFGEGW